MYQERLQNWINDLRSGKYKQGRHFLHCDLRKDCDAGFEAFDANPEGKCHCCLGVAELRMDLPSSFKARKELELGSIAEYQHIADFLGLTLQDLQNLAIKNDVDLLSFEEIAKFVEREHLPGAMDNENTSTSR